MNTKPKAKEQKVIQIYEERKVIHPKKVNGIFAKLRIFVLVATQIVFYIIPWFNFNGRQAFLFDIEHRLFYLLNMVLVPSDLIFLSGLLFLSAFGLFWWTTIAGRLWCGYACPQTVYTEIMLWIDYFFEGDRNKRLKLDKQSWNLEKLKIKLPKYITIFFICAWTGITFVGWFTPIRGVIIDLFFINIGFTTLFAACFYGFMTFLFAHIMREQVCKFLCPYARFQSAMFDKDTLIISYDVNRGEPRGVRKKNVDNSNLGDCVSCTLCVQVCPVGIDIRDGLQYECIGCAACIDACDDVMIKINKPKGLIRYTTEAVLEGEYSDKDIIKKLRRPKVLGYGIVLFIVFCGIIFGLLTRDLIKIEIVKDRGVMVRQNKQGWTENVYSLLIVNASDKPQIVNSKVSGFDKIALDGFPKDLEIAPGDKVSIPVRVSTPDPSDNESSSRRRSKSYKIKFIFNYHDKKDKKIRDIDKKAVFMGGF